MTLKNTIKALAITAIALVSVQGVSAQDVLARQAPIDRNNKAVDSMAVRHMRHNEDLENPSSDLYDYWDNVHAYKQTPLPDEYKINLRGFCMPTKSRVITSNYGRRWGRNHRGLDIKVYIGDTIYAAFSGKVRVVKYDGNGYGKYIVIRHNNGLETIYGHLSHQIVHENQIVRAGQPIGLGGNTGRSTGSHLHFETRLCGVALNPALMFDFRNQDVTGDYYVYRKSTNEMESERATALRGVKNGGRYTPEEVRGTASQEKSVEDAKENNKPVATHNEIRWHVVAQGETLESVAKKYNMSVERLCRLNNIGPYTQINRGNQLRYQ